MMNPRKLILVMGFMLAASGAAVMLTEGVAFAHHAIISGTTACPGPDHVITWSIGNSQKKETMTIDSAVATLNGTNYSADGYVSPVPDSGSTSATTTIPGALTGTVTLTIHSTWSDGHKRPNSGSVDLDTPCPTTTTTTPTTTPVTTAPPVTTTPATPTSNGVVPPGGSTDTSITPTTTHGCVTGNYDANGVCSQAFTGSAHVTELGVGGIAALGVGAIFMVFGGGGLVRRRRSLLGR